MKHIILDHRKPTVVSYMQLKVNRNYQFLFMKYTDIYIYIYIYVQNSLFHAHILVVNYVKTSQLCNI
jgi:hypothetical protein